MNPIHYTFQKISNVKSFFLRTDKADRQTDIHMGVILYAQSPTPQLSHWIWSGGGGIKNEDFREAFYLWPNCVPYLLQVFEQTALSKQGRPKPDAAECDSWSLDQMLQNLVSDLGLFCLPIIHHVLYRSTNNYREVKWPCSNFRISMARS